MRPSEGGAVPAYNVQVTTDTANGVVVEVAVTTEPGSIGSYSRG